LEVLFLAGTHVPGAHPGRISSDYVIAASKQVHERQPFARGLAEERRGEVAFLGLRVEVLAEPLDGCMLPIRPILVLARPE
jgi:hypothetical protein